MFKVTNTSVVLTWLPPEDDRGRNICYSVIAEGDCNQHKTINTLEIEVIVKQCHTMHLIVASLNNNIIIAYLSLIVS